ncbi:MAG: hypothetical protein ABIF82_06295 [Planctomycetota bacterium]
MSSLRVLVSGGSWYDCCSSIEQGCRAIGLDAALERRRALCKAYVSAFDGTGVTVPFAGRMGTGE